MGTDRTARRLWRAPGFTAASLLTLALGIGATTAIFSVVKGVVLDPLPYEDADRLVAIWHSAPELGEDRVPQSLAVNAVYEDEARVFEEVGVWTRLRISTVRNGEPEELTAVAVTDGVLRALRVVPASGRVFTAEDIRAGSPPTLLLSHRYWRERMGAGPGVIGETLLIGGSPVEIIGIMPDGFRVVDEDPDVYLPFQYNRATLTVSNFVYPSLGRLRDGVTLREAVSDLERLVPTAPARYPGGMTLEQIEDVGGGPKVSPLRDDVIGGVARVLWVVFGGVGMILLVACANVACLALVRAETRDLALGIRSALGASRTRVVGHVLSESLALGLLGGGVGTLAAFGALELLRFLAPAELPRIQEVGLDAGVLLFTLTISIGVGLGVGLLPVARALRMNLVSPLRGAGGSVGPDRRKARTLQGLVAVQLALALVLLVGSGLMARSFLALGRVDPGYSDPGEVLTFRLTVGSNEVPNRELVAGVHERLAHEISELPGVTAVGLTSSIPMDGAGGFDPVFFEDFPLRQDQKPQIRRFKWIGGGYHDAMGNPVVAGRAITWSDIRERARVAMITESLARGMWGEPSRAVGRRLSTGSEPGDWREIVGVTGDVRDNGISQPPVDVVYWPMVTEGFWGRDFMSFRTMKYVVRSTRVGTPGFLGDISEVVWATLPAQPLSHALSMADIQRRSIALITFTLAMLGVASAVTLLLGSVGIYGVIAYWVGGRRPELGLRIALGADPEALVRTVLRQGWVTAGVGIAVGVVVSVGAMRVLDAFLFGVGPVDPLTYASVTVVLMVVALLATYVPARKASSIDPLDALRSD